LILLFRPYNGSKKARLTYGPQCLLTVYGLEGSGFCVAGINPEGIGSVYYLSADLWSLLACDLPGGYR